MSSELEKIAESKERRRHLKERIDAWRALGYNVSGIENSLNVSLEEAEANISLFANKIERLWLIWENLRDMDTTGFEIEAEAIESELLDPGKLSEVERRFSELKERIERRRRELDLPLEGFEFDNFVLGQSNFVAGSICREIAEFPSQRYNPLFLYGGRGLGKTHLLNAIGNFILKRKADLKVLYIEGSELNNSLRPHLERRYSLIDVFLLDDLQKLEARKNIQDSLLRILEILLRSHHQIVVSADSSPWELENCRTKLKELLASDMVVNLQPPELETRMMILRNIAEKERIKVPENQLLSIAERFSTNIASLKEALLEDSHTTSSVSIDKGGLISSSPPSISNSDDHQDDIEIINIIEQILEKESIERRERLVEEWRLEEERFEINW